MGLCVIPNPSGGGSGGIGGNREAVSANRDVTVADRGVILDCTGTFALAFDPCASIGDNWTVLVYCTSGTITLDADGSEEIEWLDGTTAGTQTLTDGEGVLVMCDGVGLKVVLAALPGPAGADGKTWHSGSGAPSGGLGVDGDFYLDTSADAYYGPKASGSWGSPTSLIGPAGSDGRTVLTTSGAPSGGTGVDGDFAYDPATSIMYGPKTSGVWGSGTSLVGATGPAGAPTTASLTSGTSIALDFTAGETIGYCLALAHNPTFSTANLTNGHVYRLSIQDNGTPRTLTWPTFGPPLTGPLPTTTTANKRLVVSLVPVGGATDAHIETQWIQEP